MTNVGVMQSANKFAMQNGRFTDCITRQPGQPNGKTGDDGGSSNTGEAMGEMVMGYGRRVGLSGTGEAMGELVSVNGDGIGPSHHPYGTTIVGVMQSANTLAMQNGRITDCITRTRAPNNMAAVNWQWL